MHKKAISAGFILLLFVSAVILYNQNVIGQRQAPEPAIVDEPLIIAHRGANDRINESTLPAYQLAAGDDADFLEMDLRMTKDGELVVMHDETIDRTTTGTGKVSDYELDELRAVETIEVFAGQTNTEPIPTLEEVFETFKDTEHYYIETRLVDGEPLMEGNLMELLHQYDLIEKELVMIQSFSEKSLQKVKELEPDVPLALLFGRGKFNLQEAKKSDFPIIGMETSDANVKRVNELHRQGKQVHVFFNELDTQKQEQERVKKLNVDGYFTDYITFTQELLGRESE